MCCELKGKLKISKIKRLSPNLDLRVTRAILKCAELTEIQYEIKTFPPKDNKQQFISCSGLCSGRQKNPANQKFVAL